MDLRVWAKYYDTEKVYVENRSGFAVDLSGWTVRDSALNYRKIAAGMVVPAGEVREVYGQSFGLNNLPADNAAFEGDAVYLMDNAGPYGTGNLRAWFPYPCNPDNCGDVLSGGITMSTPALDGTPIRKPSNPGSVAAEASTTAAGTAVVNWVAPSDLGGPSVTYTVAASSSDGGAVPASAVGVTGTTHTFSTLTPGKSYQFSVKAVAATNPALVSDSVQTNVPVTPAGAPGVPTNPIVESRNLSIAVAWKAPDSARRTQMR